jgi:predicted RNase H-like HicB family nuclease
MNLSIECEREADGRWIAEITQIPGAMAYGATREEAMARAEIVALRAIADGLTLRSHA